MKCAKKVILVVATIMILAASVLTAYAAPRWSYLTMISADMDFDDNNIVTVSVDCDSDPRDINKITAKCELQKYDGSWTTIKTWTETNNDSLISYTKTYAVAKNYSYRLKVTVSAYYNSTLKEKVTGEYDETFYR